MNKRGLLSGQVKLLSLNLLRAAILIIYAVILLRTAWMFDDAYITLRVVDNFVNGYGLVWNTDERVQAFTHPLWLLLLLSLYFITREPYFTTLALSAVCSIATVALLLWSVRTLGLVLLVGVLLLGSKAFVDFSTSGLENPLSHFLIAAFCLALLRTNQGAFSGNAILASVFAGLLALNRADLVLAVLPGVVLLLQREHGLKRKFGVVITAFTPLAVWSAFSLVYYGFPFPNTFYAKQSAQIPRAEYIERGVAYVLDTVAHDPLTFVAILIGIALAFASVRQNALRLLGAGLLAYVAYVIWIGGDFARGRFLSTPFVMGVTCVAFAINPNQQTTRIVELLSAGLAMIVSLFAKPTPTWFSSYPYPSKTDYAPLNVDLRQAVTQLGYPRLSLLAHVLDQRRFYYPNTGLLPRLINGSRVEEWWPARLGQNFARFNTRVAVLGMIGVTGFYAGPNVKIIDPYALPDALLARLPYQGSEDWVIGHITRPLPDGYVSSRLYAQNKLSSPAVRALYQDLRLLSEAPLFSRERIAALLRLNIAPPRLSAADLRPRAHDLVLTQTTNRTYPVSAQGMVLYTVADKHALPEALLFLADSATTYQVTLTNDWGDTQATHTFVSPALPTRSPDALSARLIDLTQTRSLTAAHFNVIHVKPLNPTATSRVGHFRLLGERVSQVILREAERLQGANINLPAAIGLAPPQGLAFAYHTPTRIALDLMAGAWHSTAGNDRLDVSLHPISCEQSPLWAELLVNGQQIHTFRWEQNTCHQLAEFNSALAHPVARRGWNLLELRLSSPNVFAVWTVNVRSLD